MITDVDLPKLRAGSVVTINDQRAAAKKRYDARHYKPIFYCLGDLVLVEYEPFSTGTSRKLEPLYKGPFIITKVMPNDRCLVEDIPNSKRIPRLETGCKSQNKFFHFLISPLSAYLFDKNL